VPVPASFGSAIRRPTGATCVKHWIGAPVAWYPRTDPDGINRHEVGSSRQGWESREVKVLVPSIACIRTVSRSGACGGNEARSARMSKPRPPCGCERSGGNDLGGEQIWRPEHKGISAASKSRSAKSRVRGLKREADPLYFWERPMTRRKKQVNALRGTAVAWDQASEERFSEITSGTSRWQQGLIATCKGSSNEAQGRRRGEPEGMGA
jgi:hypothetical protein